MKKINARVGPARQGGMSIVELMVGVVIALMASIAIFQLFAVNEQQRRTTTSGSDGLQNATFALSQLTRIVQNAGYDLVTASDPRQIQPVRSITPGALLNLANTNPVPVEFLIGCLSPQIAGNSARVAPTTAWSTGPGLGSDTIRVMEGSSDANPISVQLKSSIPAGTLSFAVVSTWGFRVNDWVLVYEQASGSNPGTSRPVPCTFAQITALPTPGVVAGGQLTLSVGAAAAYSPQARVVSLGARPAFNQISVNANSQLIVSNVLNLAAAPTIIADDVIAMKVQVGLDVTNDDLIDEWVNAPVNEATWRNPGQLAVSPSIATLPVPAGLRFLNQIKALRVGLLVRSPQFERPDATGNCVITGAGPFQVLGLRGGDLAQRIPAMPSSGDYNLAGDQRCYRYNTVSTVIQIRNMVMSDL